MVYDVVMKGRQRMGRIGRGRVDDGWGGGGGSDHKMVNEVGDKGIRWEVGARYLGQGGDVLHPSVGLAIRVTSAVRHERCMAGERQTWKGTS